MTEFDPFDAPTSDTTHSAAPVSLGNEVTGDDLFEGGTPLATTQTLPSATESFSTSTSVAAAPAPSLGHDMASSSSFEQPHDDALVKWQEEHNRYLDEKTAKESDANMKTREKAREAYDQFLQQRQKLKDGNKKANRDAEVSFVEARDKALTAGETWARVAFFCDFQLKGEGRDTSRMRDLLIQLKN